MRRDLQDRERERRKSCKRPAVRTNIYSLLNDVLCNSIKLRQERERKRKKERKRERERERKEERMNDIHILAIQKVTREVVILLHFLLSMRMEEE